MTIETLPDPLVPTDVDLRDFPFTPIFRSRLFGSTFHARASDGEWRAGVTLWLKSWDQVPAGTLPDDDVDLCRLAELGRDLKTWRKLRTGALHGWFRCSDGRLHHKVVAAGVMEAWERKVSQRFKTECARIKKANQRGAALPTPSWEEFAAAFGLKGQQGGVPGDMDAPSSGTSEECPDATNQFAPGDKGDMSTGQQGGVPDTSRGKRAPRDRDRDRDSDREEGSTRVVKSSAGGPRARDDARPPPEDLGDGDLGADGPGADPSDGVLAIRRGVAAAFEHWFDEPDRPFAPADDELFAAWIEVGTQRGLSPADTAAAAVEEVQRQFQRLESKGASQPRSLRAVLDADVLTAIRAAKPVKPSAPSKPPATVPPPYAGHFEPVEFAAWIAPCVVSVADGVATILAPTRQHRDWVAQRLEAKLRAALGVDAVEVAVAAAAPRSAAA